MLLTDCRYLFTQNSDREVLQGVDVRIADGTIVDIGKDLRRDDAVLDCSDTAVAPGFVNTHTHAAMNVMRGLSDDKPLQAWLEEDIFPAEEHMDEEAVYWGTRHAIQEMLLGGTTTFNDMYAPEAPAAEAVDDTGMRAVLGRGVTDIDGGREDALQDSERFIQDWQDHDRITPAVAPHAIYTCSEELLQRCRAQAERFDALVHVHLAETAGDVADCKEAHGVTPAAYLDEQGLLGADTVAAHGVHLSDDDMDLFAAAGAAVSHNPCSNLKLGSGIADVPRLREHGVTVGLGTDSVASNNNLSMLEEAKFAGLLGKRDDPTALTAPAVLDMLTVDGARALGMDDRIGSVEPGKRADLVCVGLDRPAMAPVHGPQGALSNLVYSATGPVDATIVDGEVLVRDRALVDEPVGEAREWVDVVVERFG